MGSSTEMDLGGLTIVCKNLKTGATAPGQAGTDLSTTELAALDGATSANDTTGKAAILGTSGAVTFAAGVTATTGTFSGAVSGTTGTFSGAVAGTTGTFSGAVAGTTGTFSGAVAGTTGAFSGAITPTAGVAAAGGFSVTPRLMHTGGEPAIATTSGTNLDFVTTETYRAEVFVPANTSSTGVAIFNGTAVAGNVQCYLIDSTGAQVTGVLTASTAASGTTAYQRIPWVSGPFTLKGPATYWVAVQSNNSGGDLRTHTTGNFGADKQTGTTFGTLTVATAPTTFTTGVGPLASLY